MALIGPPELYNQTKNEKVENRTSGDPFMDLMVTNFNESAAVTSSSSSSSGDPCVDFFFKVVRRTPSKDLINMLNLAWVHHPLTALKLVLNLREIRSYGKSDDEGFFAAAIWLHSHHPQTLAANISAVAHLGRFKDLPELLYRLLEGTKIRRILNAQWIQRKGAKSKKNWTPKRNKTKSVVPREIRISRADQRSKSEEEKAGVLREEKKLQMAEKVTQRYRTDSCFRFLYEKISDCFAEHLKSDIESLNRNDYWSISLAAKWCPSIDSSYDRSTLLCESIARKIFPKELYEHEIDEAHYAYRVRDRLRKEVLVPLRKALELPEMFMCAGKWDEVRYNRVASRAMKFHEDKFNCHDYVRFNKYLDDVKSGKATIAAGSLLPHEIVQRFMRLPDEECRVAELQWRRMVEDLSKSGKLKDCLAVCNVSGYFQEVSMALGLLVSELSEEPWKGKIIMLSEAPKLHVIQGEDLRSKIKFLNELWNEVECVERADLGKVFNLILEVAVQGGLPKEKMVKRVFVFEDTEFKCEKGQWEGEYDAMVRRFGERGYFGAAVPEIVYWNLNGSLGSVPAGAKRKGVALVSGSSKNLMKFFMNTDGDIVPEGIMRAALSGKEYDKLVVVD